MEYRQKKRRTGLNVKMLVGLILGFIGVMYLIAFGVMYAAGVGRIEPVLLYVFGGLGVIMTGVALLLLYFWRAEARGVQEAIDGGYYVNAVITDVARTNTRVNGHRMLQVMCEYREGGTVHIYRSRLLPYADKELTGKNVRVYINRMNEKYYLVDIDPLLPEVKFH